MLESFESQFISGKIPYSVESKFRNIRTHHDFVRFYDKDFIIAHYNNLYRFEFDRTHLTTKDKEFVPVDWSIEIYNPLDLCWKDVSISKSKFHDRNSKSDINSYTKGYQQYLKVDYDNYKYWLWFDITSYVQDNYSKEVTISHADYNWLYLDLYGTQKKLKTLKEYLENADLDWSSSKAVGHIIGFTEAQEFSSFVEELNEELNSINFGNKYSVLYDSVLNGKISKEDFLKEIL